jgi:hypothetical protein
MSQKTNVNGGLNKLFNLCLHQLDNDATFTGIERIMEESQICRIYVLDHLLTETADHDVETNGILDRRRHQRRIEVKVNECSRLFENLVFSVEKFPIGLVNDFDRVRRLFIGRGLNRNVFSDEAIRRRKKKFRENFDIVPTVFPVGRDVLVDVVGAEPTFCFATDVLVLAGQKKDVHTINAQAVCAIGDQI